MVERGGVGNLQLRVKSNNANYALHLRSLTYAVLLLSALVIHVDGSGLRYWKMLEDEGFAALREPLDPPAVEPSIGQEETPVDGGLQQQIKELTAERDGLQQEGASKDGALGERATEAEGLQQQIKELTAEQYGLRRQSGLLGCCRPAVETETSIELQSTNGIQITPQSDCKIIQFPCRPGHPDANGGDLQQACANQGCYFAHLEACNLLCPSNEGTPDADPKAVVLQSSAEGTSLDVGRGELLDFPARVAHQGWGDSVEPDVSSRNNTAPGSVEWMDRMDRFSLSVRFPKIDFASCCGSDERKESFLEKCTAAYKGKDVVCGDVTQGSGAAVTSKGSAVVNFEGSEKGITNIKETKNDYFPSFGTPAYEFTGAEVGNVVEAISIEETESPEATSVAFCQLQSETLKCSSGNVAVKSVQVKCCGDECGPKGSGADTCSLEEKTKKDMANSDAKGLEKAKAGCDGKNSCVVSIWGTGTRIEQDDACSGNYKKATVEYSCTEDTASGVKNETIDPLCGQGYARSTVDLKGLKSEGRGETPTACAAECEQNEECTGFKFKKEPELLEPPCLIYSELKHGHNNMSRSIMDLLPKKEAGTLQKLIDTEGGGTGTLLAAAKTGETSLLNGLGSFVEPERFAEQSGTTNRGEEAKEDIGWTVCKRDGANDGDGPASSAGGDWQHNDISSAIMDLLPKKEAGTLQKLIDTEGGGTGTLLAAAKTGETNLLNGLGSFVEPKVNKSLATKERFAEQSGTTKRLTQRAAGTAESATGLGAPAVVFPTEENLDEFYVHWHTQWAPAADGGSPSNEYSLRKMVIMQDAAAPTNVYLSLFDATAAKEVARVYLSGDSKASVQTRDCDADATEGHQCVRITGVFFTRDPSKFSSRDKVKSSLLSTFTLQTIEAKGEAWSQEINKICTKLAPTAAVDLPVTPSERRDRFAEQSGSTKRGDEGYVRGTQQTKAYAKINAGAPQHPLQAYNLGM